ncbi:MAG: hypothetical protein KAJ35_08540, partial [Thermoplasmata archaeon]|nr:hypothetical protein [Thermoplasmata archaeon]
MSSKPRRLLSFYLITSIIAAAAIALVLLPSGDAEAGGTGDYPPPSTGHWYINQPTNVWQENIELPRS